MKLAKLCLVSLVVLIFSAVALGQPGVVDITYFDDGSGTYPALGCLCTDGTPYPDGTSICIYWDVDGNGPDPDDIQPEVGTGYAQVNFNCSAFNGEAWGAVGFFTFDPFLVINEVPGGDSARYYLRVSAPATTGGPYCCWTSTVFTVVTGPQQYYPTPADWTCVEDTCVIDIQGDPPAAPTNFRASDDAECLSVTCRWNHTLQNVQQFVIERERLDGTGWTTMVSVSGSDTVASFSTTTDVARNYRVSAVNIHGSAVSNTDNGSAYLLRFAPGAAGNLMGMNLAGSTHTIEFERPAPTCASGAKLFLVHSDSATGTPVQWGLLASCSLCVELQFTLPSNNTLNFCKLVLRDSSFLWGTIFTDTTDSMFHLGILDADVRDLVLPDRFDLAQNFPNPFNPETQIVFNVPTTSDVRINVYNIAGQLVRTLTEGRYSVGVHQVTWDGRNNAGQAVSAGLYLYRMEAPGYMQTKKMLLMK